MARYMDEKTGELWRAVVGIRRMDGSIYRDVYGPYERRQDAAGMLTRMSRHVRHPVEKYIEKTAVNWEPVE